MNDYKRGVIRALIFYFFGVIVTFGTHQFYGWEYVHAPPPSFIPILIFAILGFGRTIWNIKNIRSNNESTLNKGELTIFAAPSIAFVVLILALFIMN